MEHTIITPYFDYAKNVLNILAYYSSKSVTTLINYAIR